MNAHLDESEIAGVETLSMEEKTNDAAAESPELVRFVPAQWHSKGWVTRPNHQHNLRRQVDQPRQPSHSQLLGEEIRTQQVQQPRQAWHTKGLVSPSLHQWLAAGPPLRPQRSLGELRQAGPLR